MLERALHKIFFARETPFAIEVFSPLRTVLSEKRACARARARARGHLPSSNSNGNFNFLLNKLIFFAAETIQGRKLFKGRNFVRT